MLGTRLQDRYRVDALLGEGGMGRVWRAHDTLLGRDVAVKELGTSAARETLRERWLREARAAARLNHVNLVSVYDAGLSDGAPFIVMELVQGGTLRDAGPLDDAQMIEIACRICDGLEHAHAHGIVHRDLKPENVLLARHGGRLVPKLTDLGIAPLDGLSRVTTEGEILRTATPPAPA